MRRVAPLVVVFALAFVLLVSAGARAAGPIYDVKATWGDTNLPPGGEGQFSVQVRNIGDGTAEEAFTIKDELPEGVRVTNITWNGGLELSFLCTGVGTETATCELPAEFSSFVPLLAPAAGGELSSFPSANLTPTGYLPPVFIDVAVDEGASGVGTNVATMSGGGAPPESDVDQVPFTSTPAGFDIVPGSYRADVFRHAYPGEVLSRQAGDHPFEQRVNFDITAESRLGQDGTREIPPTGLVRDAEVVLPRGLIGNPEALPKCSQLNFAQPGVAGNATACPADTQVGYLNAPFLEGGNRQGRGAWSNPNEVITRVPIYNLVPPKGTPVDLGFNAATFVQGHIYAALDPAKNYAIKSVTPNISALTSVRGTEVTIWGVPGDPAHDKFRYYPTVQPGEVRIGAPFTAPIRPFFTNPMDCGFDNGGARISLDSYQHPGVFTPPQESPDPLNVEGCDDPRFSFAPDISLQPTDAHAEAPTGLDVHLEVPLIDDEVESAEEAYAENGFRKGIATPPIKKAVVTLPEGMTLSPSAAQGLGSCSSAQIGLVSTDPVRFNSDPVTCPSNSQYGTLALHTPILPADAQPEGRIYIAKQNDNAFHNFLSLYLVIEEPDRGILVKIPGRVDLDPQTGRITTTFDELPQFPVSDMTMILKGGVRAGLVEPATCGRKTIEATFYSWQEPGTPHSVQNSYDVTQKPDGSPCVNSLGERPFRPTLDAGTISNAGGSYSPFVMRLTRTDDDQEFSQLGVTLPPGLAAKFAGVGICPDAGIAQAMSRKNAGDGALEQSNPSCPASSLIGTTEVGAGVGVPLTYVPGKVYLAGPYRSAPMSIVVITPAVAGPFDLGVIAVRTALNVNPETAQGSALTDPFPQIFQGIPVRIRDIRLNLDRPGFTLNPTSCAEKQIDAHITGTGGDLASTADDTGTDLTNRFQAADCANLGFKPKLALHLLGGTGRGDHPKLKARVTYPKKGAYANIARASVALPHSEFLEQSHIKTVCTRVQFAAKQCPAASVYGRAVAKTPLFDAPLKGPVYLRSSSHQLPDLVAVLKGPASQPVEVDLDGRIDSVNGGIRNTFDVVPDAPVETFTLTMQGAKKGLLVNSTDLCAAKNRATAKFTAQNGREITLHPAMQNSCGKKHRKARKRRR